MKRTYLIAAIALSAVVILVTGCKKDKEEEEFLTLAGNTNTGYEYNDTYTFNNLSYLKGPACSGTYHRTQITFNLVPEACLYIDILQPSNGIEGVPTGTFALVETTCESGFIANFEVFPTTKADYTLAFSSGTITVTKSGEAYVIDVNLIIAPASGGGTIKGKYTGTVEPIDM